MLDVNSFEVDVTLKHSQHTEEDKQYYKDLAGDLLRELKDTMVQMVRNDPYYRELDEECNFLWRFGDNL